MRLSTVALGVKDLGSTKAFWVDLLGFTVSETWPDQLVVIADPVEILFDHTGEISPAPGLEIMIRCDRETLDEKSRALEAAGRKPVRPARDYGGPLGFEVTYADPDGYKVCLHTG